MREFVLNGGSANSSYNQLANGGSASSLFYDFLFGGSAIPIFGSQDDMIFFMNLKLDQTDCWSGFNDKYRYYRFLVNHSMIGLFYRPENLPPEPIPADNSQLDC